MKIEVKNISTTVTELTLTVPAEDAAKEYNKVLNSFKKMVVVPGFRKGKAPQHMLEKLYGEHAKEEFFNQKLGVFYKKALETEDITPINQGEVVDAKWEKGSDLVAVYRYEVMPEIKVENYEGLEIPFEEAPFKPEMIDATLEDFRKQMGSEEDVEVATANGDIITAKFKFIDEDKNVTKEINRTFALGDNVYCASFNSKLAGSKIGDEVETLLFTKADKHKDDDVTSDFFGKKFLVEVIGIKRQILPEINDEFAKDLEYDSLDAMKVKLEEELKSRLAKENYNRKREAVLGKLIEANPFELPKSMLENYAQSMAKPYAEQYNMELEQLVPIYMHMAEFNMKSHYILDEYKKAVKLEVTEEDKEVIINEAAENMKIEPAKYKELYAKQIEDEDFVYAATEKKAIEQLAAGCTFVAVPVPEPELIEEESK